MNFHSVKVIMEALNVDRKTALRIRGVVKGTINPDDETLFPQTDRWIRQCYHRPDDVSLQLSALNELINGFGVEGLGKNDRAPYTPPFEYINTGDTYNTTIIRDNRKDRFFISTWGDVVETHPRLFRE
jgi:hypothetical protein